jgi:hypothetical protein
MQLQDFLDLLIYYGLRHRNFFRGNHTSCCVCVGKRRNLRIRARLIQRYPVARQPLTSHVALSADLRMARVDCCARMAERA